MAQVKKVGMRDAVLAAAFDHFSRDGYTATSVAAIARAAGMAVANVYIYFPSKLSLIYEVYRPWLEAEFARLRASVQRLRSPRTRVRRIFVGIWWDIPAADHCFANTLIEALATAPRQTEKPNNLLVWSNQHLTQLLRDSLPEMRRHLVDDGLLAHVAWMAFDGFAINRRLGDIRDVAAMADRMTDLLLGPVEVTGR